MGYWDLHERENASRVNSPMFPAINVDLGSHLTPMPVRLGGHFKLRKLY